MDIADLKCKDELPLGRAAGVLWVRGGAEVARVDRRLTELALQTTESTRQEAFNKAVFMSS